MSSDHVIKGPIHTFWMFQQISPVAHGSGNSWENIEGRCLGKNKILAQLPDPQMVIHAPPELCYTLSLWLMPSIFTNSHVPEAEMASHTIMLLPLCLTVGRSLHLPPSNLYTLCCQTAQTQTHECTTHYTNFSLTICCALLQIADSIFLI